MSWTDEEIDALVREAANSKKIAYKDAYWQEMEAMLGSAPVRKTLGWWWFSGLVFLGIIISATFVASNTTIETPVKSTILASVSQQSSAKKNEPLGDKDFKKASEKLNSTETSNVTANHGELGMDRTSLNPEKSMKSNALVKNQFRKDSKNLAQSDETNGTGFRTPSRAIDMTQGLPNEEIEFDGSQHPMIEKTTEDLTKTKILISSLDLMNWNTSMESSFDKTQNNLPYLMRRKIGFYASLSGGIGQSYLATDRNNAMQEFGIQGGVEYFTKKWAFGVGIGYRQQFVDNLTIQSRRQYYTFGLMNINQSSNYDQLLFADLNISANYRLGRSELGVILSPSYLLGARLNYSENREEILGNQTIVNTMPSEGHQFVSSSNFKSFGVNAGLSYNYLLKRNVWVGLNVNTRLGGNLLNDSFKGTQRNVPIMVDFGIKKRF